MSQPWPPAPDLHRQNPPDPSTPWGPPSGQSGAWGPQPGARPQAVYGHAQAHDQAQAYAGGSARSQAQADSQAQPDSQAQVYGQARAHGHGPVYGQAPNPQSQAFGQQQGYGQPYAGQAQGFGQAGPQAQAYGQAYGQAQAGPGEAQAFGPEGHAYGSAGPQAFGQAGPQGFAAPGVAQCRLCGCVPAVRTTFRAHHGMIIMMRFLHLAGPFCRDCGLATFRRMTAETLIAGWWGYASFVITPITVLINLTRRGKVAHLPPPSPPAGGPHGRPLDPGSPLLTRPHALIGLAVPIIAVIVIVTAALTSS